MRKIISVLMVLLLISTGVFASSFSGNASIGFGANFDNGEYGFIDNSTSVAFDVDLVSTTAEKIAEGDVYAQIKGSLELFLISDPDQIDAADPIFSTQDTVGLLTPTGDYALALKATIDEAKVAGENWYVSILGVPSVNDFAESAIDTWTVEDELDDYGVRKADYDENATYEVGYNKAPGVEVGLYGYTFGFGFKAEAVKEPEFNAFNQYALTAYAKTPEYALVDGFTLQAGATYALLHQTDTDFVADEPKEVNAVGGSLKLAYADDLITASVATDIGYDIEAEKFGADVALAFGYDFITVDGYYATEAEVNGVAIKNLLSVKTAFDLASFDVPVALTLTGKDLVNKQDLDATVDVTVAGVKLSPSVGYVIKTEEFSAGLDAEYTHEYFKISAGVGISTQFKENDLILDANAAIETESLVPGAKLKLAWANADDLLNNSTDADETQYGKVTASVSIDF